MSPDHFPEKLIHSPRIRVTDKDLHYAQTVIHRHEIHGEVQKFTFISRSASLSSSALISLFCKRVSKSSRDNNGKY